MSIFHSALDTFRQYRNATEASRNTPIQIPSMQTAANSEWRENLTQFIRENAKPVDKFSHQPRLYRLAAQLAAGQGCDDDVLFAAAWLHDLGVFIGQRPENLEELAKWDHVAHVVAVGPKVLERCGFPHAKVPGVLEAIRAHLPSAEPRTPEGLVLRDADILEQLGAVGILRTVSKVGRDTRFLRFDDALKTLQKNLDHLPHQLRLQQSREFARERIQLLRHFLNGAAAEAGETPW